MRALKASAVTMVLVLVTATMAMGQPADRTMTASGLQIIDSKVGTGATPQAGQICVMHYTGWLLDGDVRGRSSTVHLIAVHHSSSSSVVGR